MAPRSHLLLLLPATAALLTGVLAGCAPTPADDPTDAPPQTTAPEPSEEPSEPAAAETPIDVACDELVSADVMYNFNPNFGLLDSWTPEAGTAAAEAVDLSGVACRWQNGTSNETIDLSVAHLSDTDLEALKNEAVGESTMVPTYGEEAYFSVVDGVGTAIVFEGPYWLVAASTSFFEPGDASEIVHSALDALP
jgi:hypothetical protein